MQDFDLLDVEPIRKAPSFQHDASAFRRAHNSAGAQRHKCIFQEPVKRWGGQLAHSRSGLYPERFDFPAYEMIDPFQAPENRFWLSSRTRSEVDGAWRVRITCDAGPLDPIVLRVFTLINADH